MYYFDSLGPGVSIEVFCYKITFKFQDKILSLLGSLHSYHETFFPVLRCLHILVGKLPKQPLGKQVSQGEFIDRGKKIYMYNKIAFMMQSLIFPNK